MTQQRGAASGLSGLSQGMSQMEFSQDGMSQMMRGSSQMGHDGMLSQDSTYQGDRHHSTNEGFLSQLWKNGIFDWWNQSYWRILNCVAPHGFLISALEMVYQKIIVVYRKKPACLENVSSRETAKEWEKNYCNF